MWKAWPLPSHPRSCSLGLDDFNLTQAYLVYISIFAWFFHENQRMHDIVVRRPYTMAYAARHWRVRAFGSSSSSEIQVIVVWQVASSRGSRNTGDGGSSPSASSFFLCQLVVVDFACRRREFAGKGVTVRYLSQLVLEVTSIGSGGLFISYHEFNFTIWYRHGTSRFHFFGLF
jgi:hypothetical protein